MYNDNRVEDNIDKKNQHKDKNIIGGEVIDIR